MTVKKPSNFRRFFASLGPGLITGASDDDPSGIATYSQSGAKFGLVTLWTALVTFPLMVVIQEMCARIGVVTSEGLTTNLKKHYPKFVLYIVILFCFPAIILNIASDIAGMGAVAHLVIPSIPSYLFAIVFTILLTLVIVFLSYKTFALYLKYLCLSLLVYLIIPFLSKQNWWNVIKYTFIPHIYFNKEYISILVAILGTTISPYLFFWQTTMEAEEKRQNKKFNSRSINDIQKDVRIGMFFSNLIMFFIILTTGTILFQHGITRIDTVEQAASALKPLAGNAAYLLFAIGVIGTGCLTIPILSGSLAYIVSATFDWSGSIDKKYYQAKLFYLIIIISLLIGLLIDLSGISAIKALIFTAILYGLIAPFLILIILIIANNKKIMGKFTNGVWSNLLGGMSFLLMAACAFLLLYFSIF